MQVFSNNAFEVLCKPFGEYQTNCYLVIDKMSKEALIVDAGIGASAWVKDVLNKYVATPLAILNTHGHFDHTWSNAELLESFKDIALLCPYEDAFMLQDDCFSTGLPSSTPTLLVGNPNAKITPQKSSTKNLERKDSFTFGDFLITFICYPGHTPGCSVIILAHKNAKSTTQDLKNGTQVMFSGDFIFNRSIGRSDFPYASSAVMKESLEGFLKHSTNMLVLPGHGGETSIFAEKENIPYWLRAF